MKNLPLKCPCALKSNVVPIEGGYICTETSCSHAQSQHAFCLVHDIPILISEERTDTVCDAKKISSYVHRSSAHVSSFKKLVQGESKVTKKNCAIFIDRVKAMSARPKILVIGAGEPGSGTDDLWQAPEIDIHGIDIYASPSVDIVCDAHYLPLEEGYYDGVWIQAVLEHVVEPGKVVDEIFRVLKIGGIVYAETPFMQQVHEGAYDFTRYTVTGHRYLFRKFALIDMGGNKGPEIVLAWAIRYFMWSITKSRTLGRAVGLIAGVLLKPFGYLVSAQSMFDGPSGVFFMGRKDPSHTISHKDLVRLYKGQF